MLAISHRTPTSREQCQRLADDGARVFEVDLRAVDGRLVVTHYLPLIAALPRLQHDGWNVRWHRRSVRFQSFEEVRDLVPEQCELLLDLKDDRPGESARLTDLVLSTVPEPGRYHASSKDWAALERLRDAGFRTWRSVATRRALARLPDRGRIPDHAVAVRHTYLTADEMARLGEVSPRVIAWTVNSVERARALRDLGVYGIATDSPAVLRALSGEG